MTPKLPSLNSRRLISVLKRHGFALERLLGSRAVFFHPLGRRTAVPIHRSRDLGKEILRQIMSDAGLTIIDRTGE